MMIDIKDEEQSLFSNIIYKKSEKIFELKNEDRQIEVTYEPVLDFSKINVCEKIENYELYILYNKRAVENSIYQVYVSEKRIGWIFPFQALLSDAHDYSGNRHFLPYAYAATSILLSRVSNNQFFVSDIFYIQDSYKEDFQILILDKSNLKEIGKFSIDNYAFGLFKKGYSFSRHNTLNDEYIEGVEGTRLNIKAISSAIENSAFINELFKSLIPIDMEHFAKFQIIYQIVELLIISVFNNEFKKLCDEINEGDADKIFALKDKLNGIVNEKNRVIRLMSSYSGIEREYSDKLNSLCKSFLLECGETVEDNMPQNLYKVRCKIVHSFYTVDVSRVSLILKELNDVFLYVCMQMIDSFHLA